MIDLFLKGIRDDNKTARPKQLDAISKKQLFDKSEPILNKRQPEHIGDPHAKAKPTIIEPHLVLILHKHKTGPTFNSCLAQKGMPSTAKHTSTIPIVNLGLGTITRYNFLHFELTASQIYGNNQWVMDEGVTKK